MGIIDTQQSQKPVLPLLLRIGLPIWFASVVAGTLVYVAPAENFADPEWARLVVFHVPCAIIGVVAYIVSTVYAVGFLRRRVMASDVKSAASARLGLMFTAAATVLGMVFARIEWGSAWNWDPRETTVLMLMVVYSAYFALRGAIPGVQARARISAVYNVLACVVMPFFVFVLPRTMVSLHPNNARLSTDYRMAMAAAMVGFVWLYLWLFRARVSNEMAKLKR